MTEEMSERATAYWDEVAKHQKVTIPGVQAVVAAGDRLVQACGSPEAAGTAARRVWVQRHGNNLDGITSEVAIATIPTAILDYLHFVHAHGAPARIPLDDTRVTTEPYSPLPGL